MDSPIFSNETRQTFTLLLVPQSEWKNVNTVMVGYLIKAWCSLFAYNTSVWCLNIIIYIKIYSCYPFASTLNPPCLIIPQLITLKSQNQSSSYHTSHVVRFDFMSPWTAEWKATPIKLSSLYSFWHRWSHNQQSPLQDLQVVTTSPNFLHHLLPGGCVNYISFSATLWCELVMLSVAAWHLVVQQSHD